MPVRNKPYEQFGPYLLFKKLESDSLSELWRAGRIDQGAVLSVVALRRFVGGDHVALAAAAAAARAIVPQLSGTSFARNQVIDAVDGIPFVAHDYSGGRSLRHIVDRARGATGTANPIPLDQVIAIAEKVALSLATTGELKVGASRLVHGGLVPQLVWIADDGEIRVAGQGLGPGLAASLRDARVAAEIGRYFAPELRQGGAPSKSTEVFALGALLHLLVTGSEPPDTADASAFAQAVRGAKAMNGTPVPDDIRVIVERSLTLDPVLRYPSVGEMKQQISSLANSGRYSATTFNLAFYVSSLLKKELEGEALDREREMKVNLAPYLELEAPPLAVAPAAATESVPPMFASAAQPKKSRLLPLAVAVGVVVAAAAGVGWFMMPRKPGPGAPAIASTQPAAARKAPIVSNPLVASTSTATDSAGLPAIAQDETAHKKAFEEAVQQKLQEELMKLQQDYTRKLQQQQSKQAPVQVAAPAGQPRADENAPSAAQLDQQRLASRQDAAPVPQPAAASVPAQQANEPPVTPAPAETVAVREGDIVDVGSLDTVPKVVRPSAPVYPAMAVRQRAEATIFVTALITETGDVADARILRGDKRFGFEDAALRAVRATKFSPATKDGKRVKVWFPVPVAFRL